MTTAAGFEMRKEGEEQQPFSKALPVTRLVLILICSEFGLRRHFCYILFYNRIDIQDLIQFTDRNTSRFTPCWCLIRQATAVCTSLKPFPSKQTLNRRLKRCIIEFQYDCIRSPLNRVCNFKFRFKCCANMTQFLSLINL